VTTGCLFIYWFNVLSLEDFAGRMSMDCSSVWRNPLILSSYLNPVVAKGCQLRRPEGPQQRHYSC